MAEMGRHISHELRTTLSVIQESAALLREEKPLSIQQIRLLEILIRNIHRLNSFVMELLAHSESYSTSHAKRRSPARRHPEARGGAAPGGGGFATH